MRKSTDEPVKALEFEEIKTTSRDDGQSTSRLYAVENRKGIFRRVPLKGEEERPEGAIVAWFDGSRILLVPAPDIEQELSQAGFVSTGEQP